MILDEMDDYDVYDDVVMNLYDELSADPGLSHGRGGAWDHLWCGLHLLPN